MIIGSWSRKVRIIYIPRQRGEILYKGDVIQAVYEQVGITRVILIDYATKIKKGGIYPAQVEVILPAIHKVQVIKITAVDAADVTAAGTRYRTLADFERAMDRTYHYQPKRYWKVKFKWLH